MMLTCALCGHLFPLEFVLSRGAVTCACGMRIEPPRPARRHHVRLLVVVLGVISLITAAIALSGRIAG